MLPLLLLHFYFVSEAFVRFCSHGTRGTGEFDLSTPRRIFLSIDNSKKNVEILEEDDNLSLIESIPFRPAPRLLRVCFLFPLDSVFFLVSLSLWIVLVFHLYCRLYPGAAFYSLLPFSLLSSRPHGPDRQPTAFLFGWSFCGGVMWCLRVCVCVHHFLSIPRPNLMLTYRTPLHFPPTVSIRTVIRRRAISCAYRWRSLARIRQLRASSSLVPRLTCAYYSGSNLIDQLILADLVSHPILWQSQYVRSEVDSGVSS